MRRPISWSALADASVGVWGLGVEGQASIRRLRSMGRDAVLVDDAPPHPHSRRARGADDGVRRAGRTAALRRRGEEPGHQPLPAGGGAAREGGGGGLRRPRPLHGGGRSRPASPASPARRARARRPRWPSTCSRDSASTPGPAGTSGSRRGTPRPIRRRTTGSSRPRASRSPTWTTRPGWSPSPPCHRITWTGTGRSSATTPTSSHSCTKPGVTLALADGSDDELRAHAGAARTAPPLGHRRRGGARRGLVGRARTHRAAQRAQRLHGAGRARGTGHPGRIRHRPARRRGAGLRRAAQPLPFPRLGGGGRVRRRRPFDQRAAGSGCAARLWRTGPWRCSSVGTTGVSTTRRSAGRSRARRAPTLVVTMPDNGPRIGQAVRDAGDGRVEVIDAASLEAAVDGRGRLVARRRRGAAVPGRAELRALRRLPRALGRLCRGRRPLRDAQLSSVSRRRRPAPAPRAR